MTSSKLPIIPASFFAFVLGIVGLANAWRAAAKLWAMPAVVGEIIYAAGSLVWLVLILLYVGKWIAAPATARAEIADPIQCCFVGLAGVSTMLVGAGALPYSPPLADTVFALGAVSTIGFGIWRTGLVWRGGRDPAATTAVLYLPLVAGCFVLTIGLSALGLRDWAQYAFGAGFFSWLAIESVLIHRLYTAAPLTEGLRPTLGIQLAPPAVGAVAYIGATATAGDPIVHALIGYAILQVILLARMMPWITRRFVPSLWAFSFGATALATASETLAARGDSGAVAVIAIVAFCLANLLIAVLAAGTISLLATGKLIAPAVAPRAA